MPTGLVVTVNLFSIDIMSLMGQWVKRDMIKAQIRLALACVGLRQAWHNLKVSMAEILENF